MLKLILAIIGLNIIDVVFTQHALDNLGATEANPAINLLVHTTPAWWGEIKVAWVTCLLGFIYYLDVRSQDNGQSNNINLWLSTVLMGYICVNIYHFWNVY